MELAQRRLMLRYRRGVAPGFCLVGLQVPRHSANVLTLGNHKRLYEAKRKLTTVVKWLARRVVEKSYEAGDVNGGKRGLR